MRCARNYRNASNSSNLKARHVLAKSQASSKSVWPLARKLTNIREARSHVANA